MEFAAQLCELTQTKLTTTVEEDTSDRQYHLQVQEREEKAVQEKAQLDHKLKLQRIERSKRETAMKMQLDQADEETAKVKVRRSLLLPKGCLPGATVRRFVHYFAGQDTWLAAVGPCAFKAALQNTIVLKIAHSWWRETPCLASLSTSPCTSSKMGPT